MMGVEMDPMGAGLEAVSGGGALARARLDVLRVESWYVWTDCMEFA